MKKYIIYSIIYLLIYTISSCKDDDELGINTMTATINGETKLFDVIEARPYPAISEFIITGIICDDTKQKLILSLPMDLEIGTYNLGQVDVAYRTNVAECSGMTNQNIWQTESATIIINDTSNNRLRGAFNIQVKYTSQNLTTNFTMGQFDVHIDSFE